MVQLFEVDPDVFKKVAKSLNKTEESINEDVEYLAQWMGTQAHLPEIMDAKFLQNFLIRNKCDLEKTKKKIDMYYTIRGHLEHVYAKRNPKLPCMKQVMETVYFVPLPKLTEEMYRVYVFKIRDKQLINKLSPYSLLCHSLNVMEIAFREDVTFGDVIIVDCSDITVQYCLKYTPKVLYHMMVNVYQQTLSSRLKAMYVINAPPFVMTFLAIGRVLVKPKIFERICLCKDDSILKNLSPEILPKNFGGEAKSLEELQEILSEKFVEYQERFDQLDGLRVDESLRTPKTHNWKFFGFGH